MDKLFESAVHNNPTLTSIDKFNYLKSLLESQASEAVSGLTLTSANYEEAISTLKEEIRQQAAHSEPPHGSFVAP